MLGEVGADSKGKATVFPGTPNHEMGKTFPNERISVQRPANRTRMAVAKVLDLFRAFEKWSEGASRSGSAFILFSE